MSDIESYESLIEYEGFETPALAYIEENRQERVRDLEDAQDNGSIICVKVASRPSDSRLSRSSVY